ncbi:hypothetical protein [Roseateles sp. BYS87W]|uniref:PEP-CTERM sorting domain-containing protein n=1 Tax=Pelomonas baiyunensis TaxID=3299026 RepID=A0ABW7GZ40_9BURK
MPTLPRPSLLTLYRRALAACCCAASLGASAAPTLTTVDLRVSRITPGIAATGIAQGSHLAAHTTQSGDLFAPTLGVARQGVLGVSDEGGLTLVATDRIRADGSTDAASTGPLALSARGGIARSLGFVVAVNSAGGLTYFDPQLSPSFSVSSAPGLFSLGSDLLAFDLPRGQSLFGQVNTAGAGTGLLGTTADGRLRLVRTDGAVGSTSQVSRPLGFAADTGLAMAAGFIVGVNTQHRVNLYEPSLDLLLENVGPAGLFSDAGDLETLSFDAGLDANLFDLQGDVIGSLGVLGLTDSGGLAYLRLDVVPGPGGASDFATLKPGLGSGLDAEGGLVLRNGIVTALAAPAAVPEPPIAALVAWALACALRVRPRIRSSAV